MITKLLPHLNYHVYRGDVERFGPKILHTDVVDNPSHEDWKSDSEYDQKIIEIEEIDGNEISDQLDLELMRALRAAGL